jgi:hypothetical protein
MIIALFALAAFQDAPVEPATRAELDAVLIQYKAAKFNASIGADGKMTCTSNPKVNSAELSIRTCIVAMTCARQGKSDRTELAKCIDADRAGIAKDYRRDWLKSHGK